MKTKWNIIIDLLQVQPGSISVTERLVSIAGGFLGILLILIIDHWALGAEGAALLIASMGASAVLLFAAPHGVMSQPWPLVGGHVISAIIGVGCAKFIPDLHLAAAMGVGLAIGGMQFLRCLHPPGGATALVAVVGGDAVHTLGYQFVLTPVFLNVFTILIVGVLFNIAFSWRRYPASLSPARKKTKDQSMPYNDISHADFVAALSELDTFIDVSEQDLLRIYDLVTRAEQKRSGTD